MTPQELYKRIDTLNEQLKNLQPLKVEDEERIWKKFRLEWNYNSNHMEGNTLTYGHTELLLFFDQVAADYTGREIEEMKAHDVAIKMVVELSQNVERDLSESFIRQLNQIILVRSFWKESVTLDGKTSQKEIIPGEYKNSPNNVKLQNGEIFRFSSPEATPSQMHDLIEFYKVHDKSTEKHPLWLAAMLHYKFVRIHPFDDGNGRVARLLMNYVLLKYNFPPVIIKDEEKKKYLAAINKADIGNLESFVEYIGEQLIWSLSKSITAAEGKTIDDENDLDKEIALLSRSGQKNNKVQLKKSREVIQKLYQESLEKLLVEIENHILKFEKLFFEKEISIYVQNAIESTIIKAPGKALDYIRQQIFFDYNKPKLYGYLPGIIYTENRPTKELDYPEIYQIKLNYYLNGYLNEGVNTFNSNANIILEFSEFNYKIYFENPQELLIEKLYNDVITETEIKHISNIIGSIILGRIKEKIEPLK